jgi:hypothetical protein
MPIKKDAQFWQSELDASSRHERKWRTRARRVLDIYRGDPSTHNDETHYNILWANTQTQRPALYSSTPKPVVKRRYRQAGEVGKLISQILTRCLEYSLDPGGAYDFDRVGEKLILDYLLPGRMMARVKYHPVLTEDVRVVSSDEQPDDLEFDIDDEGKFVFEEKYDELVSEETRVYHTPWDQYRQAVANNYEDVWWRAWGNNFLTREEIIDQFGAEHNDVPLTHISHQSEKDGEPKEGEERVVKRAQVWEIWDKDERKVYAVIEGYSKILMEIDDPLKLRQFYPGPEPVMIVETPDSNIPIPEYCQYQAQAEELNIITRRIENLVKAMKLSGIYPGSNKDIIKQMLDSDENMLVPVEDWGAITERGGLNGMIEWLPLRDVADAWQRLMVYRAQLVQSIFELTGISDIQRGATDPRETKGAQQIKASFAGRRLLPKQQDTQRFFRDLFRLQAEIIAEHFQPETIAAMAQMQLTPQVTQAIQAMKDDALRSYSVDIETDSTIAPDEAMEKQGVAEFTSALSQMLAQVFPIVQAQPAAMGPLGKMIMWMTRKFRIARDAEEEMEGFLETFSNLPEKQDTEAQAEQQKAQAEMQMKAQEQEFKQQVEAQKTKADIQRKDAEAQAKIQREREAHEMDMRKAQLDIEEKQAKIQLMREETEAKLVLDAVVKTQQANSQNSDGNNGKNVEVSFSSAKTKRIDLIRDSEGKISGAKVVPEGGPTVTEDGPKQITVDRDDDGNVSGATVT